MQSIFGHLLSGLASGLLFMGFQAQAGDLPPEYAFVQEIFPSVEITEVRPSPVDGVLEMVVGADIFYITSDGRYLLQGELFDIKNKVSVTEKAKQSTRLNYVNRFDDDRSILFAADDPVAEVLVFTDIDCGYCRKLHRQMDGYLENGISIRYLFFPRSGPDTASWSKAETVWCAESRQDAMTRAKNNEKVESDDCDASIVASHYKVGGELGLTGTPALLTKEGALIVGYRSPDELLELLGEDM